MRLYISLLAVLLFCVSAQRGNAQIITTFAGTGAAGYSGENIDCTISQVDTPFYVATDKFHNVYLTNNRQHRVRKINSAGIITTIAGTGVAGNTGNNGPATDAQINLPMGICVDDSGNVYFAEMGNDQIRKVNTAGIISLFAGTGVMGYTGDNGPATAATLYQPSAICLDTSGNIYETEFGNSVVRKISTTGIITTITGTGATYNGDGIPATAANVKSPYGVTVDKNGSILIADTYNYRIRKIDAAGIISTIAGNGMSTYNGDNIAATAAHIFPVGIITDKAGSIFFSDRVTRIRMINSGGIVKNVAGNGVLGYGGDNGPALLASFNNIYGLALYDSASLLMADGGNNRIRRIKNIVSVNSVIGHELRVAVSPNPSHGDITIELDGAYSEPAQMVVVNMLGKVVLEKTMTLAGPLQLHLDQPSGIYLLTIKTATRYATAKISIEQ